MSKTSRILLFLEVGKRINYFKNNNNDRKYPIPPSKFFFPASPSHKNIPPTKETQNPPTNPNKTQSSKQSSSPPYLKLYSKYPDSKHVT